WRTQGETQEPYEYPFAPHQVDGLGNRHYRWPLSAAWFNIINPASTLDSKRIEILDYMLSKNMNRIRFALTAIQDPTMVTHHVPAAGFAQGKFSHSVWPRKSPAPPAANNFQPANIDFERFDLDQWTQIDAFIGECASRNIHASVILALPHTASYENQIFGVTNQTATWPPATAPAITDPDSAFGTRWELYYWYTIGRLCTYTNIHYCPLLEYHVMGPGPFSNPNTNGFSHNFASGAATAFVALEPYLNREGTSRLMSVQGQRGSYYARPLASTTENGAAAVEDCATDMFTVGYENNGTSPSRLSLQISPFLDPSLHTFPNHIALHRGGELGKSSITQMHNYAGSDDPFNPPPPALGHRQLLESVYYAPRPIFIEEDWVAHENGVSSVSPLNNNEDNPYRRATKEILSQTVQNVCRTNPYSFDFLEYPVQVDPSVALAFAFLNFSQQDIAKATGNINGMKKFYRDAAWMTGIIAQGYLCWFSPFYADPALQNYNPPLNGLTTSESLKSAAIWALHNPWWTFVPDHSIVITQSPALQLVGPVIPLTPPGYAQRFPYELEAVAAYCSQVGSKQYIIYSPYGAFSPTQSPVPTTLTLHLARLQPGESFTYRFHNPDNYTPDAALQIGTTNASSQVVLTPGVLDPTAPYGEFVLEINP
ncbi:MAG TPA: hypothetical protein PKA37_08205, partial [Planctomycetota bacterium]|nr:hypothetical protein [Planctomycetota bacterium]